MFSENTIKLEELSEILRNYYNEFIEQANNEDLPIEFQKYLFINSLFSFCIKDINLKLNTSKDFSIEFSREMYVSLKKIDHAKFTSKSISELENILLFIINFLTGNDIFHYIQTKNDVNEQVEYFKNKKEEINLIVEQANRLNTEHALKGFKGLYFDESKKQNTSSIIWLSFAFLFVMFLMISIGLCFYFNVYILEDSSKSLFIFANEITFNLVLLSIALWCARMYSINNALKINYQHKSVSADALLSFVAAIKDDAIIKNTILLESSRMIFAVPEIGLTNKENKLDIKLLETIRDINPVNPASKKDSGK